MTPRPASDAVALDMLTFFPERTPAGWGAGVEVVIKEASGYRHIFRFALDRETLAEIVDDATTTALTVFTGREPAAVDDGDPRRREWGGWP